MSEAKQSLGRVLFEEKDEAFTNKKNSKKDDFLILFFKFFLKPLTLTLSPQVGRGDCGDDFFQKVN